MRGRGLELLCLAGLVGAGLLAGETGLAQERREAPSPSVASQPRAPAAQLERTARPLAAGAEVVRSRQRVGGRPVLGAQAVAVRLPGSEPPRLISDHTVAGLEAPGRARLDARSARALALAAVGARAEGGDVSTRERLVVEPSAGRLVWRVVVSSLRPPSDLELLIDAADGSLIARRDLTRTLSGRARLFDPNPISTNSAYRGLVDRGDRDYKRLNRERQRVRLLGLRGRRGCLRGVAVEVRRGGRRRPVCRRSRDWTSLRRSRGSFEALMAYEQVDRARRYLDSLDLSRPLERRPQRVHANGFGADNSFFIPSSDLIVLGRGGVDDGEDGDIIVHEYGHAVQEMQAPGIGRSAEAAAIGEGFGDYLAAVVARETSSAPPRFDACVGEWDSVSYAEPPSCLRRADSELDRDATRRRCDGDPHCIGMAWSGALWDLRAELGDDDAGNSVGDRLVVESQFMLSPEVRFRGAARALLATDAALYPLAPGIGAHEPQLEAEMVERGFCPPTGC